MKEPRIRLGLLLAGSRLTAVDFGAVAFEITSDADHGRITATLNLPSRAAAREVWLRLRHPRNTPIKGVTVNGQAYPDVDPAREAATLHDLTGDVRIEVR